MTKEALFHRQLIHSTQCFITFALSFSLDQLPFINLVQDFDIKNYVHLYINLLIHQFNFIIDFIPSSYFSLLTINMFSIYRGGRGQFRSYKVLRCIASLSRLMYWQKVSSQFFILFCLYSPIIAAVFTIFRIFLFFVLIF